MSIRVLVALNVLALMLAVACASKPVPSPSPTTPPPTQSVSTPLPIQAVTETPSISEILEPLNSTVLKLASPTGWGSGVMVDPSGGVVTAAHVVGDSPVVTVFTPAGGKLLAKVVWIDRKRDLAYLQLPGDRTWESARIGEHDGIGQDIYAVGYPLDSETITVTKGIISLVLEENGETMYQIDAAANHGASGGALIDRNGLVLGFLLYGIRTTEPSGLPVDNVYYAISAQTDLGEPTAEAAKP